jgi:hypothetical protein
MLKELSKFIIVDKKIYKLFMHISPFGVLIAMIWCLYLTY